MFMLLKIGERICVLLGVLVIETLLPLLAGKPALHTQFGLFESLPWV